MFQISDNILYRQVQRNRSFTFILRLQSPDLGSPDHSYLPGYRYIRRLFFLQKHWPTLEILVIVILIQIFQYFVINFAGKNNILSLNCLQRMRLLLPFLNTNHYIKQSQPEQSHLLLILLITFSRDVTKTITNPQLLIVINTITSSAAVSKLLLIWMIQTDCCCKYFLDTL